MAAVVDEVALGYGSLSRGPVCAHQRLGPQPVQHPPALARLRGCRRQRGPGPRAGDAGRNQRSRRLQPMDVPRPPNLVALGQAALRLGAEPKLVLENFFDQAKRADPNLREAYLASGDLALDKEDFGLAAKIFGDAIKKFPEDPEVHFGLARAYAPSARPLMLKSLEAALSYNSRHVPALLLLADHALDAEDYGAAGELLEKA